MASRPAPEGGLFSIPPGGGKTIIGMLAPKAMGLEGRALILTPASLREQTLRDYEKWSRVFPCTPPRHMSYAALSQKKNRRILFDDPPALVICDEAHYLKNFDSARTNRFLEFAEAFEGTRFVFMSGTFARASITEFWHLAALALREGSPLPIDFADIQRISRVIDAGAVPGEADMRALRRLGRSPQEIRRTLGERLAEHPGVVWSDDTFDGPLKLFPWNYPLPKKVQKALDKLETRWELPDGEMLVDSLDLSRHARTLPWGFWLRWDWDAVGGYDEEWNEARLEWGRRARAIKTYGTLDALSLVEEKGAARKLRPTDQAAYDAWVKVKDRPHPPSVPVTYAPEVVDEVLVAARKMGRGVVWYRSPELGDALRSRGLPTFGAGDEAPLDGRYDVVALSSRVFGTGTDGLQDHYHRALVLQPLANPEQTIARLHRPGQRFGVEIGFAMAADHQRRSFFRARRDAGFAEDILQTNRRILSADWRIGGSFC